MTPRESFGVVDSAIARATNLLINEALKTLQVALDELDQFGVVQKCDVQDDKLESEGIEAKDLQKKGEEI